MRFLKELFQEGDGKYSHKRMIVILSFVVMLAAFISNTYWGIVLSEFLIDNFMYIIIGGMGITTAASVSNNMLGRERKVTKVKKETYENTSPE
jgi:hypothetical protein